MKFIINDEILEMSPCAWPEGSTFRFMYEGDRNADEYKLVNPRLKKDSVRLIIDVVTKNVDREVLNPNDVNWIELNFAVDYLGICSSVDYIYPLFLTKTDRKNWYERSNNIITIKTNDINTRDPNYDIIGKDAFKANVFRHKDNCTDIIGHLSHIKGLFVSGDYVFSKFLDFKKPWINIDIFAYGNDSLDHIKDAVAICLKYSKNGRSVWDPISFRDNISITVPVTSKKNNRFWISVRFVLKEFRNPSHILNNIDLDSLCIGFKIEDPDIFYALPRFVRAYETNSNTVDPTFRSPEYIERLINAIHDGFDMAIPGFNKKNLKISPTILKKIMSRKHYSTATGLQTIIISSLLNKCITKKGRTLQYNTVGDYIDELKEVKEGTYFVVDDVLNEGQRDFIFKGITYTPEHPRIELVPENKDEIRQVQESSYGGYYM